jgi:DNA-binding beta-propeller fold protein YncE
MPLSRRDGTLFVVSDLGAPGTDAGESFASIIDLSSGDESFVSQASQILPSRDGTRWYALRWDGDQTAVAAYEAASGLELWYTPISQTVGYIGGGGPGVLALSPAEASLYVLSYDSGAGEQGIQWLQVLDTATGALAAETIPLVSSAECGAPQFLTPAAGSSIYIKCPTSVKTLDSATGTLSPLGLPVPPQGIGLSPDGGKLSAVLAGPDFVEFDLATGAQTRRVDHQPGAVMPVDPGLVALSADGSRLVVGHIIQGVPGTDTAAELRVYDTATWAEISRINYPKPIRDYALAVSADGSAIYAVTSRDPQLIRPSEIIVEFDGATGAVRAEHLRPNENIQRLQFQP